MAACFFMVLFNLSIFTLGRRLYLDCPLGCVASPATQVKFTPRFVEESHSFGLNKIRRKREVIWSYDQPGYLMWDVILELVGSNMLDLQTQLGGFWQHQLIRYRLTPWISGSLDLSLSNAAIDTTLRCGKEMLLRLPDTEETHESPFGGVGFLILARFCVIFFPESSEIDGFQGKFHDFRVQIGETLPDDLAMLAFLSQVVFFACFHHFRRVNLNHKPQVFYRNLLRYQLPENAPCVLIGGGITHLTLVFGLKGPKQKTQNKNKLWVPRWSSREFGISGMCPKNSRRKLLEEKRAEMLEMKMRRGKKDAGLVWRSS